MAPRTIYAGLTDGLQPFSLFDQSLADMGNLGMIPCTASGTNAIVLTPFPTAFAPTITIPNQLQNFSFVAAANSTGSITIQVGTTTALKLYKEDGVTQAAANDLLINVLYGIVYNSALNGAAGGFQIVFPITSVINPVITGATISSSTISSSTISGSTITTSTYNGNTWTAGTGILTIAALKTLTASSSLTLAGTDGTTLTFQGTDTYVGRATTDTLTNKTLTTPTIGAIWSNSPVQFLTINSAAAQSADMSSLLVGSSYTISVAPTAGQIAFNQAVNPTYLQAGAPGSAATVTLPTVTDSLVARSSTDTLTNKTFDTAGAGNVFKINGVGITANTGTGSNVLATSPSLTTPNIGAATATTVVFSPTTGGIIGTTTNDSTSAGNVGEYIESVIVSGSATSLTSTTPKNITSISLTAGDWDVSGLVNYGAAGSASVTYLAAGISTTTGTLDQTNGRTASLSMAAVVPGTSPGFGVPFGPVRLSLSGTTTVFMVSNQVFTVGTLAGFGLLRARRVR